MVNLNEMKVIELKAMAKELDVPNWWTLKKDDLITEISFAIADKEDAGEDVDVEALTNAEPSIEPEPEIIAKPKRGELIRYNGKAQNLCAWAEELGINANTLYGRLYKLKWPIERAFAVKK